ISLRPEITLRGVVVTDDGSPLADAIVKIDAIPAMRGPEGDLLHAGVRPLPTPAAGEPRFARTDQRGEFSLRVRSLSPYMLTEARRVARSATGATDASLWEPLEREMVRPDAENRIVVRKKG